MFCIYYACNKINTSFFGDLISTFFFSTISLQDILCFYFNGVMFETNATQKALGYKNRCLKLESEEGKLTNFLKHQKVLRYVWKRSQHPVSFVFDHSLHFSTAYKNNKRCSFPSVWRVADSRHELKSNKSLKWTHVCLDLILDNISYLHFYCCKISSCKKEINSPTLAAERSRPVIHALIAMTEVCMWPVLTWHWEVKKQ